jgi:hypothetical protein
MRRAIALSLWTVAAIGLAVISFIVGVHVGSFQYFVNDSLPRAVLTVGELRTLRDGKWQSLVPTKELELDAHLLLFARYGDGSRLQFLWPLTPPMETDRYLTTIALYRKEFPSTFRNVVREGASASDPDTLQAADLLDSTVLELTRKYAK